MKTTRKARSLATAITLTGLLVGSAHAVVTMTLEDTASGVKISIAGTLSGAATSTISSWTLSDSIRVIGSGAPTGSVANGDVIHFSSARFQPVENFGYSGADFDHLVSLTTTEEATLVGSISGGRFGIINDSSIIVQRSGSNVIPGSFIVGGRTLDSLGLVAGTSSLVLNNGETLTVDIVPEPSSSILIGLGSCALFLRRSRR